MQTPCAGDEQGALALEQFSEWLLRIGNGMELVRRDMGEDSIRIPDNMCCNGEGVGAFIEEIYGGLRSCSTMEERITYITQHAIVTPFNDEVDKLCTLVDEAFPPTATATQPAEKRVYLSADSVVDEGHGADAMYPTEFLNSLDFSGVPPHKLQLQVGSPVILLRNLSSGMANGTRMIVTSLMDRFIEVQVASGPLNGQRVLLPRLSITPSDVDSWPFTLRRRQFPIRSAWAMTINKSQGQTFQKVGIYLPRPVFSHGQLYVALSRTGNPAAVRVFVPTSAIEEGDGVYTRNVVYNEVLL
jgi:ATP-dependent DNA helicase PIF1